MRSLDTFKYGKFRTKIKAVNKQGTCTSFFTFFEGPDWAPEKWNEIDFDIVPSVGGSTISTNIIFGDGEVRHERHLYTSGIEPSNQWHTYEIEWTPYGIKWIVDGTPVRETSKFSSDIDLVDKEHSIMMNFWTPEYDPWR